MPIPKVVAVFNKHVTNRLFLLFAGWIPPLAIVNHQGRNSGQSYGTPIMAIPYGEEFIFALTYGRNVDWAKNLMASDSGILEYNGEEFEIHKLRHISYEDMKDVFPIWIRLLLSIISVEHCIIAEKNISNTRLDPSPSN
jgi:deazaflavin-dependent oxidoreductase (nitroreductase family)